MYRMPAECTHLRQVEASYVIVKGGNDMDCRDCRPMALPRAATPRKDLSAFPHTCRELLASGRLGINEKQASRSNHAECRNV